MNLPENASPHRADAPNPGVAPWVWFIASVLYLVSPIDIIPDLPVVGHIDDVLFGLATTLNLVQAYVAQSSQALATIVRLLKIGVIILGGLLTVVIALLIVIGIRVFS